MNMKVGDPVTREYALKAAKAIYLECPEAVADDVSRVIKSLVDQIDRLTAPSAPSVAPQVTVKP